MGVGQNINSGPRGLFRGIDAELNNSCYWDMYLSNDLCSPGDDVLYSDTIATDCLITWIDLNESGSTDNFTGACINSLVESKDPRSSGFSICDIGLTGVDNGRFENLSGETLTFTSGDTKLTLCPVSGQTHIYPIFEASADTVGRYSELCGGFYQGFFSLDDYPYDVLPTRFEDGWTVETWIKVGNADFCNTILSGVATTTTTFGCPDVNQNTLNATHPNNNGFFFYIGTRAENKFCNVFSGETGLTTCSGVTLTPTCEDINLLEGDNTFLQYSRCNTATNKKSVVNKNESGINPFLKYRQKVSPNNLFNIRCNCNCECNCGNTTGFTVDDIVVDSACTTCLDADLVDNTLGFRITSDGHIGWRRITTSGECSGGTFVEEVIVDENYSEEPIYGLTDRNKWLHVTMTYRPNTGIDNICDAQRTGTLSFFVNGRRIHVEEDFLELNLRALSEHPDKQQGVPFNISWGGGTQGLSESQTFGGPDPSDSNLSIEENFAGNFFGGISQLRMYGRAIDPTEIRLNFNIEKKRYQRKENFGGAQIFIIKPVCSPYLDKLYEQANCNITIIDSYHDDGYHNC